MRLEIKSVADDGTFEGMLSPYGNVDQGNDVVEVGAFTKSLAERGSTVPLLWQHDQKCPIGTLTLTDTPQGLKCRGALVLTTDANGNASVPEAQKAYALLKAKVVRGLSIGYDAVVAPMVKGVRRLQQVDLWEGSVVTFPMNQDALISSVKSLERKGEFEDTLADMQLSNLRYMLISALDSALGPIIWSGAGRADILTASEAVCDSFRAAYMEFIPAYLDYLTREYGIDTKSWRTQMEAKQGGEQRAGYLLSELKTWAGGLPLSAVETKFVSRREFDAAELAPVLDSMRSLLRG